jgi:indole-3-glycerol phosphate synthase
VGTILETIIQTKRHEVEAAKRARPAAGLEAGLAVASAPRDFYAALTGAAAAGVRLIAEIKKSSPSAGLIRKDFDPVAIARIYAACGAAALSVLTDQSYFGGDLSFIGKVKHAVTLPVLRKDFIVDEYQLLESRAAGADAVLLIAEALSPAQMDEFSRRAAVLGMSALIEVHDLDQLQAVRHLLSPDRRTLLGINNRDLHRQRVDLETTRRLAAVLPRDVPFVAESGIRTRQDVLTLADAGAAALLIGETFMRADDIAAKVRELLGTG